MKLIYLSAAICFLALNAKGQEPAGNIQPVKLGENVNVKFGGFARADYYFDTRKGKEAVDGLFYLWPDAVKKDAAGKDMNALLNNNLSATATRFSALFYGPEALKAKTSAYFEFDFTAGNSGYVLFRQAWIKLDWTKSNLQIGRNWHPLQGPVVPSTISLNYGAPFNIFCRGEQIRYSNRTGAFTILAATFWQAGHASFGPNVTTGDAEQSLRYLRNAVLPDLNLQLHYTKGNFTTGLMGHYKKLKPREYTNGFINNEGVLTKTTYQTNETVGSFALATFGQYKAGKFVAKGNVMYGQNLAEMMMQGGYARLTLDAATGHETYTASSAVTSWLNLTYGEKIRWGLFGGYQKNLGYMDVLDPNVAKFYGRSPEVASMWRLSPSVSYSAGRMLFQFEGEITTANYGVINYADKGKVDNAEAVTNFRLGLSASFLF
jgi:hypothetical protein